MKPWHFIALGLAAFLYALVVHAPVASLHAWLRADPPPPMDAVGLDGSLARGRAAGITQGGRAVVNDIGWKLKPLALLAGRLSFDVEGGGEAATLKGRVTRLPLGDLRLKNFHIAGSLKTVLGALGQPFVPYEGSAELAIARLTVDDGIPLDAEARAEIRGLSWALAREPIPFGDFQVEIVTDDEDAIVATVSALRGNVEAAGEARLLADEARSWSVDLRLKARPGAPPLVMNQLRSIGPADSSGYHHLKRQGTLARVAPAEPGEAPPE
jgi:general secretion pathway protein N